MMIKRTNLNCLRLIKSLSGCINKLYCKFGLSSNLISLLHLQHFFVHLVIYTRISNRNYIIGNFTSTCAAEVENSFGIHFP